MSWFSRLRPLSRAPHIPQRSQAVAVARVELAELSPVPPRALGQTVYLTIVLFENMTRTVIASPTTQAKLSLMRAAANMLRIHEEILAQLQHVTHDPVGQMEQFRESFTDFQRRTQGKDWQEMLLSCYLCNGFLLDFFTGLASGLPRQLAERVTQTLQSDTSEELLRAELSRVIENDPVLASRLAVWGRRLVGDTMLIARSAAPNSDTRQVQERVEPVFTELIAAHTRRMDALGLTA